MLILFLSILITMVKTTSIASQDISMQSKCLVNQKKKINRTKSSVQYYSNYTTTYRIIWSGDIETNPGTGLSKPKCQVCDKIVQCNQILLKSVLSNAQIINWTKMLQIKCKERTWLNCVYPALPFYNGRNLDFDSIVACETTILHTNNCHI